MKLVYTIALPLLLSVCAWGQTVPDPPKYWVAAGVGWNHYSNLQALGWVNGGAQVTTNNYIMTSIDMTSQNASIRASYARVLSRKGAWGLLALGDGGILTGESSVTGVFGPGGAITYDISRIVRSEGMHLVFVCRVLKSGFNDGPLNEVKPVFQIGIGKSF